MWLEGWTQQRLHQEVMPKQSFEVQLGVFHKESGEGCSSSSVLIPELNMTSGKLSFSVFPSSVMTPENLSLGARAWREGSGVGGFSLL